MIGLQLAPAGTCREVIGFQVAPAGTEDPEEKQEVRHLVGGGPWEGGLRVGLSPGAAGVLEKQEFGRVRRPVERTEEETLLSNLTARSILIWLGEQFCLTAEMIAVVLRLT